MKLYIALLAFTCFEIQSGRAQSKIPGYDGLSYSRPFQIDSSDYYVLGSQINKSNKSKYSFSNQNQNYGGYEMTYNWTNIFIYNSEKKEVKKMFSSNLAGIYPVQRYSGANYDYDFMMPNLFSAVCKYGIIILVKDDEYNHDGIIDEDDPVYLFVASKAGENMRQITPKGTNLISWKLSRDSKTLIVMLQKDKNGNKKFTDDDQLMYQIDMNEDISRIKITEIVF